MYVYIQSERSLWTVGFYKPDGSFEAESDHGNPQAAANRVHWLNGGNSPQPEPAQPDPAYLKRRELVEEFANKMARPVAERLGVDAGEVYTWLAFSDVVEATVDELVAQWVNEDKECDEQPPNYYHDEPMA